MTMIVYAGCDSRYYYIIYSAQEFGGSNDRYCCHVVGLNMPGKGLLHSLLDPYIAIAEPLLRD